MVLLFLLSPEVCTNSFLSAGILAAVLFSRTFMLYSSHLHVFTTAASSHEMWCVILSLPLPHSKCLSYQTMDMNQELLWTPVIYGCTKPSCCRMSLTHTLYLFLVKGCMLFIVYEMCICLVVSSDSGGSC